MVPASRVALAETDLRSLAEGWRDVDPNPDHRDAVTRALAAGPSAVAELFEQPLGFGTAGLRGALGPGPAAMNRVLVRIVASALGQVVAADRGTRVVIGFDGRHQSDEFALDTARVLAAAGIRASLFDQPAPTPTLAFAVRHLEAAAGVMVTASHNPRTDNGYKIYGADGALLAAPHDDRLAELMRSSPLISDVDLAGIDDPHIDRIGDEVIDAYAECVAALLHPGSARTTRMAYTPLHGVGRSTFQRVLAKAGFPEAAVVADQAEPDGDFPTAPFPNPEEPGALDGLFTLASDIEADLAVANDPDADRLAIAVPTEWGWRLLSGDELGCLLAEYLLSSSTEADRPRLVVNTVVSSRLLGEIAAHHNVRSEQTLTGFKWIMQAQSQHPDAEFVLGYEEAMGYGIGDAVRDKDGMSAAIVTAEMVAALGSKNMTMLDALDDLHRRHGVHVTGQRSLRFEAATGPSPRAVMQRLRSGPPTELGGYEVLGVDDLLDGGPLPPTDALILALDGGTITVRPSGTEPKLKLYGECRRQPSDVDLRAARADAHRQLATTLDALSTVLCDPERAETRQALSSEALPTDIDIEQRSAARFGGQPESLSRELALRLVVRSVDLTTLAGDDTAGRVRALCAQARRPDPADPTVGPTAAVCVYPNLVRLAAELTRGSGVAVASVASAFPSGLSSLEVRLSDIAEAVCAGADEIDVVLSRATFLEGRNDVVAAELDAMRQQIGPRSMKVILETSELETPAAIRKASRLAMDAGADWIKTSTGKSSVGATPMAVMAMAEAIAAHVQGGGARVGLKISGGVRTSADALGYLAIIESVLGPEWLDPTLVRFGASGLLGAVVADLGGDPS